MRAGAERFHDRLFSGETSRKLRRATTAVGDFAGRIDALQETIAEPLNGGGDAIYFDDVDPDGNILQMVTRSRKMNDRKFLNYSAD